MPEAASIVARFLRQERGATAIEYALLASLIALVIIGSIAATGQALGGNWDSTAAQIANVLS